MYSNNGVPFSSENEESVLYAIEELNQTNINQMSKKMTNSVFFLYKEQI